MASNAESAIFLIILAGFEIIKKRKVKRSVWTKKRLLRRGIASMSNTLMRQLRYESTVDYKRYLRVDPATFDILYNLVYERIVLKDTNMRCCISASDKLMLTLRYLATVHATLVRLG